MSKSTFLEVEKVSIFGHSSYKSLKAEVAKEKAYDKSYTVASFSQVKSKARLDAKYGGAGKRKVAEGLQSFKSKLQPRKTSRLTIKAPKPQSGYNPWR